jgi:hypothetical protein
MLLMVNTISSSFSVGPAYLLTATPVSEPTNNENAGPMATGLSGVPSFSTLSRQLADSAVRAEHRENTLSRKQLGELAGQLNEQISGDPYYANKAMHDKEVPDSSDPERLARAKAATDFVSGMIKGDPTVKNPFTGLSRDQLTLIKYDDSGSYTVNERRAAMYGANALREEWAKKVCDMAMEEYKRTGFAQSPKVLAEMLSEYRALPRIEQAQHPEGYEASLQSKLGPDALTTNN